jgi:hypothetical protein
MALKSGRIEEYRFSIGSLTASAGGLFDVYSSYPINGTIDSIGLGSNTFTNTGSLSIFLSGTDNVAQTNLIIRLRAGSYMQTFYPFVQMVDNQGVAWTAGSVQTKQVISSDLLRVVGSGLGNGTSGLYVTVRYT